MIKDQGRGWAWTRALLGIAADEVHLCGEPGAIDLVRFEKRFFLNLIFLLDLPKTIFFVPID